METTMTPSSPDDIRSHRQSFDVPTGFNRTTDPPCQSQKHITDVFINRTYHGIHGYIVVKRLTTQGDTVFWSTEEYRNNNRYQQQQNSYGTAEKSEVQRHIEQAAENIRTHSIPE